VIILSIICALSILYFIYRTGVLVEGKNNPVFKIELVFSEFLLKKLLAYRIMNSEGFEDEKELERNLEGLNKKLKDFSQKKEDELFALKIAHQQIKSMSDIDKMRIGPEATICVIAESYGMLMRKEGEDYVTKPMKNKMYLKKIVEELDKYRPNKIAVDYANYDDGFFDIVSYISKTIELEVYDIFVQYDKKMLYRQIDIAIKFQFNSEERRIAFNFETEKM
jgi:hypothetical protein